MNKLSRLRVAWLFPSLERGFYWQPVLSTFTQRFPNTIVFTGFWPGFATGLENSFDVKVLRRASFTQMNQQPPRTSRGLVNASIVRYLLPFRPHVIFASAFSMWTAVALALKPWCRWRVIIAYDGSSPNVDCRHSSTRLFLRRGMVRAADAFITNSRGGKVYLMETLKADESQIFARPYEVPTPKAMLECLGEAKAIDAEVQRPVFLFVGSIIPPKGLRLLLEACSLMREGGCHKWTLLIVGDGPQRSELEDFIESHGLEDCVKWVGWVNYDHLGAYFQAADVFVLPTLEDVWGMVVLEAMVFGKPVICSKWAGAAEMVVNDENGYVIDPYQPRQLADVMKRFVDNFSLIRSMGERSKQIIAPHTPEAVASHLVDMVAFVLNKQ